MSRSVPSTPDVRGHGGRACASDPTIRSLHSGGGRLTDVTASAGPPELGPSTSRSSDGSNREDSSFVTAEGTTGPVLAVPSSSAHFNSGRNEADGDRHGIGRIPRQVTFGVVAVQTDFSPYERNDRQNGNIPLDDNSRSAATEPSSRLERLARRYVPRWLDCTSLCYLSIALLMISVGLIITVVTVQEKAIATEPASTDSPGSGLLGVLDGTFFCYVLCGGLLLFVGVGISVLITGERQNKSNAAQLWIVGPIFLCSGILVCIKAGTHVFKRLHPTQGPQRDAFGNFLVPDSRASLARAPSIPPSYSRALVAPVPSTVEVVEEEEAKPSEGEREAGAGDGESLALVTINFDPPPPSYDEAMDFRQREDVRERSRSDAAELGRSERSDHSAQFPSPPMSRSVSQTSPITTILE